MTTDTASLLALCEQVESEPKYYGDVWRLARALKERLTLPQATQDDLEAAREFFGISDETAITPITRLEINQLAALLASRRTPAPVDTREEIERLTRERDAWEAQSETQCRERERYRDVLVMLCSAPPEITREAMKSVAYDTVFNLIPKDVAEFQLVKRSEALFPSSPAAQPTPQEDTAHHASAQSGLRGIGVGNAASLPPVATAQPPTPQDAQTGGER